MSLTRARTVCWLKTPEAGSLRAAPLKPSTGSSVQRRLRLTERRGVFTGTSRDDPCESVQVIFNDT